MSEYESKVQQHEENDATVTPAPTSTSSLESQNSTASSAAVAAETVKEMRAVVLTSYGGLKGLRVMSRPEPTVADGEVAIRVKCCGLGFQDLMVRQGAIDVQQCKPPFVMGFESAGQVEALAPDVTDFRIGDRVIAFMECKAWAEVVACPAKHVYKLPEEMEYEEAIAVTSNYLVAYALLTDVACLRPGQTVLIHSVGGGVGQALAQLSRRTENVTLIGTASSHKHQQIKHSVHHLLHHSPDYVSEVRKIAPQGVDLVLDCLCGDDASRGYNLLKPLGRYVLFGTAFIVSGETKSLFTFAKSWWQVDKVSPLKLFEDSRTISGFNLRKLLFQQDEHAYVRSLVSKVMDLWREKQIQPIIDSCWSFDDIPEAMQKMHDRRNVGKITIDPAMEPRPKPPVEEAVRKRRSFIKSTSGESREGPADGRKDEESPVIASTSHDPSSDKEAEK